MKVFLDSSAFAKRFIDERGSDQVEQLCDEATELGLSVLCLPEIVSALNRRRRERTLSPAQYATVKAHLLEDARDADMINLTSNVVVSSVAILETHPVRSSDALHIACALAWGADVFVSSDTRQVSAAKRAGMRTRRV